MPLAAKVIGGVRLGLVDIRKIIEELDTEEMKQIPEVFSLVYETLVHSYRPSNSSKFAVENAKPRSMSQVKTSFHFTARTSVFLRVEQMKNINKSKLQGVASAQTRYKRKLYLCN